MSLAKLVSPHKEMVRTFEFSAPNSTRTSLMVKLRYIPPRFLEDKQQEERVKILKDSQANPLSVMVEAEQKMQRYVYRLMASCVMRIDDDSTGDGLSVRKVAQLLPLDVDAVKAMGGLDSKFHSNTQDLEPLTEEERQKLGYDLSIKTRGLAAIENIATLMAYEPFQDFVYKACKDVSLFQENDFSGELKNS